MTLERHFKIEGRPEFRIAVEAEGRIFIAVGGLQIDIDLQDEGCTVQLQHQNEVLDECSADYPDLVNANG